MKEFDKKIAIVTGAAKGLGRTTAARLARERRVAISSLSRNSCHRKLRKRRLNRVPRSNSRISLACVSRVSSQSKYQARRPVDVRRRCQRYIWLEYFRRTKTSGMAAINITAATPQWNESNKPVMASREMPFCPTFTKPFRMRWIVK